jgi:thiosulfate/3-mercaptopyruvate sulfurtransferase
MVGNLPMNMLINPAELAGMITQGHDQAQSARSMVVVDCRFNLLKPDAGRQSWAVSHIPGAFYADLDEDLAAPRRVDSGRHPLPDPAEFAELLASWGVVPETHVVAYDDAGGAVAARLWWLLRWVGHAHASLLDGGFPAWQAGGLPVDELRPELVSGHYPVQPGSMPTLAVAEVETALDVNVLALLDARDAGRFAGQSEPIDSRAGHIPGTLNRPFQQNLDADGIFRPPAELAVEFQSILDANAGKQLAAMCGSGVTACHNLFAMELAGVQAELGYVPALYVGSWSEWIQSAERPCFPPVTD